MTEQEGFACEAAMADGFTCGDDDCTFLKATPAQVLAFALRARNAGFNLAKTAVSDSGGDNVEFHIEAIEKKRMEVNDDKS